MQIQQTTLRLLPVLWAVCLLGCQPNLAKTGYQYTLSPAGPEAADVLVGVNYYAGWWPSTPDFPNKWHDPEDGRNWLKDYPQRTPLLGVLNNQETMDREIIAASEHGVDFFLILWYPWPDDLETSWYQSPRINDGLTQFMQSPQSHRMKFCVEVCNHPPFVIKDLDFWNECIDVWIEAMKHPSYLQIGGKRVLKIHGSGQLWHDCGANLETVQAWMDILRKRAREAGLGELLLCGGAPGPMVWEDHWVQNVFDFTSDYMDLPKLKPTHLEKPYPYNWLAYYLIQMRCGHHFDQIPYMPVIAAGWDPRPWGYPEDERPAYQFPTKKEWKRELERLAWDLHHLPNLGIPLSDGTVQKAFTIYAWNEFGEGGILAPTQGDGYMKLEAIREVFGVKKHSKE